MQQERNSKLFLWAKRVAFERKTAYPILVLNSISEDIKSKICISRGTQKKTGKWGHKLQDTYICKSSGLNEEKMHCTEEKTFHMELINIKKFMTKTPNKYPIWSKLFFVVSRGEEQSFCSLFLRSLIHTIRPDIRPGRGVASSIIGAPRLHWPAGSAIVFCHMACRMAQNFMLPFQSVRL